jgi:hypothetical protein
MKSAGGSAVLPSILRELPLCLLVSLRRFYFAA